MSYQIYYRRSVKKELARVPKTTLRLITIKIQNLAIYPRPRGVVKLKGTVDTYRLRQGVYRIVYQVQDNKLIIVIVRVAHRREIYHS